jgi:hypothetical protein
MMQRAERCETGHLLNEAQTLDFRIEPTGQIVFSEAIWADLTMARVGKNVARKGKLEDGFR